MRAARLVDEVELKRTKARGARVAMRENIVRACVCMWSCCERRGGYAGPRVQERMLCVALVELMRCCWFCRDTQTKSSVESECEWEVDLRKRVECGEVRVPI